MKENVKRDIGLIIITVCVLTVLTLSVSYSYFFSVTSNSQIQEFNAGTLNVTIDSGDAISKELFLTAIDDLPTNETDGVTSGEYATITLKNLGTLDAEYTLSISIPNELPQGYTEEDLVSIENVIIGLYETAYDGEQTVSKWVNLSGDDNKKIYTTSLSNFISTPNNVIPIFRSTIEPSGGDLYKTYKLYVWLSESTPTSEIGKLIYLNLDVKSTTVDGHVTDGSE